MLLTLTALAKEESFSSVLEKVPRLEFEPKPISKSFHGLGKKFWAWRLRDQDYYELFIIPGILRLWNQSF